jgi:hypothetical protein
MAVKNLGAIPFPRIPTKEEERLVIQDVIRKTEAEKATYLALLTLSQHPAWPNIQAGIKDGQRAAVEKGMKATGEEVYRFQGEYRAWERMAMMPVRAAAIVAELDKKLAELQERLIQNAK